MKFYAFNRNKITDCRFQLIDTKEFALFLLVKFLYLAAVLLVTAGVFYFHTYLKGYILPVIFGLGMYISLLLFRFINYIAKFRRFKGGTIELSKQGFEIKYERIKIKVRAKSIIAVERNVLGNLVVREKSVYHVFPVSLLSKEERKELLSNFN